jgi:hypothetical protein
MQPSYTGSRDLNWTGKGLKYDIEVYIEEISRILDFFYH